MEFCLELLQEDDMNIYKHRMLRIAWYWFLGITLTTVCIVGATVSICFAIMWHNLLLALIAIPAFFAWYILLPLIMRRYVNA